MKKSVILFLVGALACSCSISSNKPDKRDKYVGEYKLYEDESIYVQREGFSRDPYTGNYERESNAYYTSDSTHTLIITKNPKDTISLTFDIVSPFDFELQKKIIAENEEIKKRNEQSICGKDEQLIEVPQPTYSDDRELLASYSAYVEGHKIFLRDYEKKSNSVEEEVTFDSVYLRNDTIYFQIRSHEDLYYRYKKIGYQITRKKCYGVKLNQ